MPRYCSPPDDLDFGRTGPRAVIGRRRRHELEVAPALAIAPHLLIKYGIHQQPNHREITREYESRLLGVNKNLQQVPGTQGYPSRSSCGAARLEYRFEAIAVQPLVVCPRFFHEQR